MTARFAAYSLLLGNFVVGSCVTAPAGMLNQLSAGIGATIVETGLLVTWGAVVLCFGSPIMAAVTTRIDRRTLLAGSALIMALTNVASAFAPDYLTLLVIRLVMLVAAAPFTPQAAGTIALLVPEKERPGAISFVFIGWSLSIALGLPIVQFLAENAGWRMAYASLGGAALLITILLWFGLPGGLRGAPMSLKSWGDIARNRRILRILAVTAIQVSGLFAIFTYVAPLLTNYAGASVGTVAAFFAAFGVAGLVGNIIATRVVAAIGPLQTTFVFFGAHPCRHDPLGPRLRFTRGDVRRRALSRARPCRDQFDAAGAPRRGGAATRQRQRRAQYVMHLYRPGRRLGHRRFSFRPRLYRNAERRRDHLRRPRHRRLDDDSRTGRDAAKLHIETLINNRRADRWRETTRRKPGRPRPIFAADRASIPVRPDVRVSARRRHGSPPPRIARRASRHGAGAAAAPTQRTRRVCACGASESRRSARRARDERCRHSYC